MEKMTKKDYFNALLEIEAVASNNDLVAFIEREKELLSRKNSKSTESKTQIENKGIKEEIVKALQEIGKGVTITELQSANEKMATYSNQKLSALLKQLVEANLVDRQVDKKKSYFSVK